MSHDTVHDKIEADKGVLQELADYFTFEVPNARWHPKVRAGWWDGKISLTSVKKPYIYCGLRWKVRRFCEERQYQFVDDASLKVPRVEQDVLIDFISKLGLPKEINGVPVEIRDYQVNALDAAVNMRRVTLICPTASGKTMIAYFIHRVMNCRTLIIVPRVDLANQLYDDWIDYGYDSEKNVHRIYSGQDKDTDKQVVVSTWHSIAKFPSSWFAQFDIIIGDEVHGFKAAEMKGLMEKTTESQIKIGMTGTLDGWETNELVVQGLFGPIVQVTTTAELIERGYLAQLDIDVIVLKHREEDVKHLRKKENTGYQTEIDYLISSEKRNNFIRNLSQEMEGNVLILFERVEKHGDVLRELIEKDSKKPVYYVSGTVPSEERSAIRKILQTLQECVLLASKGVFSTGQNVPGLNVVALVSAGKSRIPILQSIGRGLRKTDTKLRVRVVDISDDLRGTSKRINHTLKHLSDRVKIYASEKMKYRIHNVEL